jgi:hypothetical protein
MTSNETREAFEKWYSQSGNLPDKNTGCFGRTPWGTYAYGSVQGKWEGFQAALSSGDYVPRAEVDKLVEALQDIASIKLSEPFDCYKSKHDEVNAADAVATAREALANFEKQPTKG